MFDKYSLKCGQFIYKHKVVTNVTINKQNLDFIKYIFETVKSQDVNYTGKYIKQVPNNKFLNDILYENRFMPQTVQLDTKSKNLTSKSYKLDNILVNVFQPQQAPDININNILHICHFMFKLAHKQKKSTELILNIIPSDIQKKFPKKLGALLESENINTGSSYSHTINLWRYEEIEKVLIHELIHFLEFDSALRKELNIFNVDGKIKVSEAYTETLAIVIHCTYIMAKLYKFFSEETYKKIVLYEINFSVFQCKKIMDHFNIESISNFATSNSSKPTIKQTTDVFSYFFIKTVLLLSLDNFLDFVRVDFTVGNRREQFLRMITNKTAWDLLMTYINEYRQVHLPGNEDTFIDTNLRMSCLQLLIK